MSQTQTFSNAPLKASSIIGTKVLNRDNEGLGDIKEIVIDPASGRVAYAVVSFGGFLGIREKLFAIPFSTFQYDATKAAYYLDIAKERLEAAPGFDPDNWPSMADEKWNTDLHAYYESTPYWK